MLVETSTGRPETNAGDSKDNRLTEVSIETYRVTFSSYEGVRNYHKYRLDNFTGLKIEATYYVSPESAVTTAIALQFVFHCV